MGIYEIDYQDKDFSSLTSYTSNGQLERFSQLIRDNDVGLVAEAGTPGLSDPGKVLIQLCAENDLPFTVLPGANALVPALVAAGFPTHHFRFLGFLPQKKWRLTLLNEIVNSSEPVFVYESVHRIVKTINKLKELGFNWKVSFAREISKMYEELKTMHIDDAVEILKSGKMPEKGEFVVGFWNW